MKKYFWHIVLIFLIGLFIVRNGIVKWSVLGQIGGRKPISLVEEMKTIYGSGEKVKIKVNNESGSYLEAKLTDVNNLEIQVESSENINGTTSELTINPPLQFKPGKYKLTIKDEAGNTIEQDFLWGVLAMNFNKTIYSIGETAFLAMAVLDEEGSVLCNANVSLEINLPDGQKEILSTDRGDIQVTEQCHQIKVSNIPDYQAFFPVTQEGNYELVLTAKTTNGSYSIRDSFFVDNNSKFVVERISATRIYPYNFYPMTVKIKLKEDFEGSIYEEVPASFQIEESKESGVQKHLSIDTNKEVKKIKWNVKLKAGDEVSLGYIYKAPEISPQFYLVGPLSLTTLTDLVYSEGRQWQIAADAPGETRTKTVQFYIGQDNSPAGINAGVTLPVTFNVYLPDIISSANAIKSAYIDYSFQNATTTASGYVTLRLKLNSEGTYTSAVSANYSSSGENFTQRFRVDFTNKLKNDIQSPGTYTYNVSAAISGTVQKAANAKIIITYDYDSLASTQINTVRFYGGQMGNNLAVGTSATFTLNKPSIPENSASIYSAWAEITANTIATSTTDETIQINYDSDTASSYYIDHAGGAGTQMVYLLHSKIITDDSHTLSVKPTTGYPLSLLSYEQYITYSFNYAASTSLLTTQEFMIMSNGSVSTANITSTKTINLPESSISWKSIYINASAHATADTIQGITAKLNSADTVFSIGYTYDMNRLTYNNYKILSNETNDLNTMSTGNHNIYLVFNRLAGTIGDRFASLVLTYAHAKSDTTVNASANFIVTGSNVYSTGYTAPFSVSLAGSTQSISSYIKSNFRTAGTGTTGWVGINVLPSSTTPYNYSSSAEYRIVSIGHTLSTEVGASGAYVATLNNNVSSVKDADITVNFQYYNKSSDLPLLISPEIGATNVSLTPSFKTVASDVNGNNLQYEIKICTDTGMSNNCQTFTAVNVGWSGADIGTSSYSSGTTATYVLQTGNSLATNSTYYWKSRAIDYDGSNTWSSTQSSPFNFTTLSGSVIMPALNQLMRHGEWFNSGVRKLFTF